MQFAGNISRHILEYNARYCIRDANQSISNWFYIMSKIALFMLTVLSRLGWVHIWLCIGLAHWNQWKTGTCLWWWNRAASKMVRLASWLASTVPLTRNCLASTVLLLVSFVPPSPPRCPNSHAVWLAHPVHQWELYHRDAVIEIPCLVGIQVFKNSSFLFCADVQGCVIEPMAMESPSILVCFHGTEKGQETCILWKMESWGQNLKDVRKLCHQMKHIMYPKWTVPSVDWKLYVEYWSWNKTTILHV